MDKDKIKRQIRESAVKIMENIDDSCSIAGLIVCLCQIQTGINGLTQAERVEEQSAEKERE
jgi:hypothetical protein